MNKIDQKFFGYVGIMSLWNDITNGQIHRILKPSKLGSKIATTTTTKKKRTYTNSHRKPKLEWNDSESQALSKNV